jgi:hypothetical protein
VTDPVPPPTSGSAPFEPSSGEERGSTAGGEGARAPAPPGTLEGRSRSFREHQLKRKSARREHVGQLVVVAIIVLGIVAIVTARSGYSGSHSGFPSPGPPIVVQLGTPVLSTVNCTGGGTAYIERIPWLGSTQPVTPGDVYVRVYEIWDGDYIGDPGAMANATSSNVCAGAPPDSTTLWYVVLTASNGTNLLTYTADHAWVSVTDGASNLGIETGSSLVLVTGTSFAGTGRGFAVGGFANGSPITGAIAL